MKHDTTHFKKKLEEEKKILINDLKGVNGKVDEDADDADSNLVADKMESIEENSGLAHSLEPRLLEINLALQKIEQGTFGTCEVCGNEIEADRLEANPAARTCKTHIKEHLPAPTL